MQVHEEWKPLLDALGVARSGKEQRTYTDGNVFQMLSYICAPPDLKGLIGVALSLNEVLVLLDRWLREQSKFYSETWQYICRDILAAQKEIEGRISSVHVEPDKHRVHGHQIQHPLYGLLWHRARATQYQPQFGLLQAIAIYWFGTVGSHHPERTLAYDWLRNVRILSEDTVTTRAIYPLLPANADSLSAYYRMLTNSLKDCTLDSEAKRIAGVICRLVKSAVKGKMPPSRDRNGTNADSNGGGPMRGDMPDGWRESLAEHAIEFDGEELLVTELLDNPEDFVSPEPEPGIAPGEVRVGRESLLVRTRGGNSGCYTLAGYAQKVRFAREAIALVNQQLVTRWSAIGSYEERVMVSSLQDVSATAEFLMSDTLALLSLVLVTGRECREIVIPKAENGDVKSAGEIEYVRSSRTLLLPALPHLPRLRASEDQQQALRKVSRVLRVQMPIQIARMINRLFPGHRKSTVAVTELFRRDLPAYASEIDAFLGEVNKRHGTRLTRRRMEGWLFDRVASLPGSGCREAATITGQIPVYLKNALHYFWVPEPRLREIHSRAIAPLMWEMQ